MARNRFQVAGFKLQVARYRGRGQDVSLVDQIFPHLGGWVTIAYLKNISPKIGDFAGKGDFLRNFLFFP